jgi:hypothetical protein
MKYSMRNPMALEQQGKPEAGQDTIRNQIDIWSKRKQDDDP